MNLPYTQEGASNSRGRPGRPSRATRGTAGRIARWHPTLGDPCIPPWTRKMGFYPIRTRDPALRTIGYTHGYLFDGARPPPSLPPNRRDRFVDRVLECTVRAIDTTYPGASDTSPFEGLVVELVLQRTAVGQVTGIYPGLVERYPTPTAIVDIVETELGAEIRPPGSSKRVEYSARARERIIEEYEVESRRIRQTCSSYTASESPRPTRARIRAWERHSRPRIRTSSVSLSGFRIGDSWRTEQGGYSKSSGTARTRGIE